jgi:predicted TIM-barrel fold metal-dependent hydrolase
MREHDAVLASGHLAVDETTTLFEEARRREIRCVVTHASYWFSVEDQRALAERGVFIEQCAMSSFGPDGDHAFEEVARQVRAVGPEHVVLSTDLGQAANPDPPAGLALWADYFVEVGFSINEVQRMLRDNPAALLG